MMEKIPDRADKIVDIKEKRLEKAGEVLDIPEGARFSKILATNLQFEGERVFGIEEILKIICEIALAEGISKDQLRREEEVYAGSKELIKLVVSVLPRRALAGGWGKIEFQFNARGSYGKYDSSLSSGILRFNGTVKNPERPAAMGVVAEYEDDGWKIDPHHMAAELTMPDWSPTEDPNK